jgi:hypothetical protein
VALPLLAAALAVLSLSPAAARAADTLLSQGKPATASSVEAAYVAANAVDGSTATRWSSAFSDPQWIYVDLGATVTISRVVLNWEAAYGKAYQIQVSNDATNWTTIYAVTNGTSGVNDLTVSGSGRYVRMYGTARGTRYGYSLWEFQVYGTPVSTGATLLSQRKPATASSVEAAFLAANAVDGKIATRWGSAFSDPQWIYVDLGATATIGRVVLSWEAAYGKAYQIQVSDDATNWTTIYTVTNGTGGVNDLTVSGSGRYVRMYGTARGTRYGYSLWEFQVYGTAGGSLPTTCTTLPSVPTGLAASSVSSTSVTLSWNASTPGANCKITGYRLYQNGVQVAAPTGTAASISGLAPGSAYSFTVAAVNAFGASAQSAALSVTVTAQHCKRGLAYGFKSVTDLAVLSPGIDWWYNWALQPDAPVAASAAAEFVPMIWGWASGTTVDDVVQKIPSGAQYLLAFNEPNFTSQANLTAQQAAALWPQLEEIAKRRGLKLVSPAVNYCGGGCNETDPFKYLDDFFAACQGCQVDYIAAHWYACTGDALRWYLGQLKKYGRPIWLTEFSCGDGSDRSLAVQEQYMREAVAILEADPDVFRYAWFSGRTSAIPNVDLLGADGQLTTLGQEYVGLPASCNR